MRNFSKFLSAALFVAASVVVLLPLQAQARRLTLDEIFQGLLEAEQAQLECHTQYYDGLCYVRNPGDGGPDIVLSGFSAAECALMCMYFAN